MITAVTFTSTFKENLMVIFAKKPACASPKDSVGLVLNIPMLGEIEIGVCGTGPSGADVATTRSVWLAVRPVCGNLRPIVDGTVILINSPFITVVLGVNVIVRDPESNTMDQEAVQLFRVFDVRFQLHRRISSAWNLLMLVVFTSLFFWAVLFIKTKPGRWRTRL
jgi:hypothetical protein